MSDDTAPIVVTLKAGTGYDAPWLVIRGYDPDDVVNKLTSLDGVIEATLEVAGLFTAQRAVGGKQQAQGAPTPPPSEQPKQQAWGQTPAAQQQTQQAPAQRPASKFGGQPHPEGKTCDICPQVLEKKETSSKKPVWRCPDWRWNNGAPNGHSSEWID